MKLLAQEEKTFIVYESPFRLVKLLQEFKTYLGEDRKVSVSREITKLFEETKRGTVKELITYFSAKTVKGEIVVVVQGNKNIETETSDTETDE